MTSYSPASAAFAASLARSVSSRLDRSDLTGRVRQTHVRDVRKSSVSPGHNAGPGQKTKS